MKLKIEKIERESKVSKAGKDYVSIKVIANGGKWFTGFGDATNQNWKEGQEVDTPVYTEEYQGKSYSKLGMPKNPSETQQISAKLDEILALLRTKQAEKIFDVKTESDLF